MSERRVGTGVDPIAEKIARDGAVKLGLAYLEGAEERGRDPAAIEAGLARHVASGYEISENCAMRGIYAARRARNIAAQEQNGS